MIELTNTITGILIILLNGIPFVLKKQEYLRVTLRLSVFIAAITVLFL